MALRRLAKEFKDIQTYPPDNVGSVKLVDDDMYHWQATIIGEQGTPYAAGKFEVDIRNPMNYPFKPPKVKFITKIYHCNINEKGGMCLMILYDEWSPALTISKVLTIILFMLKQPNSEDYLVPDIARLYKMNKILHDKHANDMAVKYANATPQKYYTADLPEIIRFDCKYDTKIQQIKCNVTLQHAEYDGYERHIHSMCIKVKTKDEEYMNKLFINKTESQFVIDKELEYGSYWTLSVWIEFDSTDWDRLSDIKLYNKTNTIKVPTLDKNKYLILIEGYLTDGKDEKVPMDVMDLCFNYYWKYVISIRFDGLFGTINEQKVLLKWDEIQRNIYWWERTIKQQILEAFGYEDFKYIQEQMNIDEYQFEEFPKMINVSIMVPDEAQLIVSYNDKQHTFKLQKIRNNYGIDGLYEMIRTYFNIDEAVNIYLIMDDELHEGKRLDTDLKVYEYIVVDHSKWNTSKPSCIVAFS